MFCRDLDIFLVLSESQSLTQAAKRMYMSRQALTNKIDEYETHYNTKIIERDTSGIKITSAGLILARFATRVKHIESAMIAEIAATSEQFMSTVSIGMSYADGVALLPQLAAEFQRKNHGARIHLDAGHEHELIQKVMNGNLDFAIMENPPLDPKLNRMTLGEKILVLIGPNEPPYNDHERPLSVKQLLELPMIVYEWDSGRHMVGNRHFRERYGLSLQDHNMVAQFDTHEAMVNGVRAGLGWASVPECIAQKYRSLKSITFLKTEVIPMNYPVDLVWDGSREMSHEARELFEFIRNNPRHREYFGHSPLF